MPSKSVILTFPGELVDKPVVSRAIRRYDIEVNILQAFVTPSEEGRILAIVSAGGEKELQASLDYFRQAGVDVALPVRNLVWNQDLCTSCGACTGQCAPGALSLDASGEILFEPGKCIACELCIPSCGYAAVESVSGHLGRAGVPTWRRR
jgi:L-aspartate semialdehyde sulfurtransferase ferredoxin